MAESTKRFDWRPLLASTIGSTREPVREELLPKWESDRQDVLLALAEVDYRLNGHTKCSVCRAPVRAAMRTVCVNESGTTWEYGCLCRRCLEAEKAFCRRVTSYIAGAVFDEFVNRGELVARPQHAGNKVAA